MIHHNHLVVPSCLVHDAVFASTYVGYRNGVARGGRSSFIVDKEDIRNRFRRGKTSHLKCDWEPSHRFRPLLVQIFRIGTLLDMETGLAIRDGFLLPGTFHTLLVAY